MFCIRKVGLKECSFLVHKTKSPTNIIKNDFWGWLTFIFNRVSKSRVTQLGPDRACAEWLMRNGALVRWKGHSQFVVHYDNLPKDSDTGKYYIQEVDATDASISHHGFPHFKNCNYIETIKFDRCLELDDRGIEQMTYIKNSLETLLIFRCGNLTDKGILSLRTLLKLKTLEMKELGEVQDMKKCIKELQDSLPNCNIRHGMEVQQ